MLVRITIVLIGLLGKIYTRNTLLISLVYINIYLF